VMLLVLLFDWFLAGWINWITTNATPRAISRYFRYFFIMRRLILIDLCKKIAHPLL